MENVKKKKLKMKKKNEKNKEDKHFMQEKSIVSLDDQNTKHLKVNRPNHYYKEANVGESKELLEKNKREVMHEKDS